MEKFNNAAPEEFNAQEAEKAKEISTLKLSYSELQSEIMGDNPTEIAKETQKDVAETMKASTESGSEKNIEKPTKNQDASRIITQWNLSSVTPNTEVQYEMDAERADALLSKTAQEISSRFGSNAMNAFSSELFS